jgi:GTP1/Obg family GTP-binding protein
MMSTHNVDLVAKALEECGYDCIYAEQLHNYVREALKAGYDWRKITHALIGVGWAVNVVESLLETYSQPENDMTSDENTA